MHFVIALFVTVCIGGLIMFLFGKKKPKPEPSVEEKVDTALDQKQSQISDFQRKIADLMAKRDEMQSDLQYHEESVAKWQRMVDAAAETKNESNIRTAVQQRMEAERPRNSLKEQVAKMTQLIEGLQEQLKFAQQRVDDVKTNRTTLGAREDAAKIRQGLNDKSIDLSGLEDEVIKQEATAEAYEETNPEHEKFMRENVVSHLDVDAEVQRLMKK